MTAVVRVLPRLWDGRRLRRFLTGLTMLALTLAGPSLPVAGPAPESPVVAVASAPSVTVVAAVDEQAARPADVTPASRPEHTTPRPGSAVLRPASRAALDVRAERAPPAL